MGKNVCDKYYKVEHGFNYVNFGSYYCVGLELRCSLYCLDDAGLFHEVNEYGESESQSGFSLHYVIPTISEKPRLFAMKNWRTG